MFMIVTFVTLVTGIPFGEALQSTCVPNTQFLLNGRLCYCNNLGRWSEVTCQQIGRPQSCQPGQIIWEECSQCICQENGKLMCTNTECSDDSTKKNVTNPESGAELWCTPFRSYYINCSLCVCPASGKMSEARCATDSSCSLKGPNVSIDVITKKVCIPKVMYLFTCLHCLCSDDGFFVQSKCVETCHKAPESRKCIPRTFYRVGCNVFRCPETGIPDEKLSSRTKCPERTSPLSSLSSLRNVSSVCTPNKFTKPKCIYCECNSHGAVNEKSCLEQECLKLSDFSYDFVKSTCSPGELVPTCMECFCLKSGFTEEKYCTRVCSLQNKLIMLERVLKETISFVERSAIKDITASETCDPNSVFIDHGRYCLCPDNGNTKFKLCSSVTDDSGRKRTLRVLGDKSNVIDYNATCEPNTFIEFGCNTCYCTTDGKIDQKWCTFDDCEAKLTIQEAHKDDVQPLTTVSITSTCVSGAIAKVDCNFCICGASGLVKDRSCTNNTCGSQLKNVIAAADFACEPAAYYTVDCNICFCGTDGVKNVNKCTKNQCEPNFLRSDTCTPGELFSDDCNICICPPNGEKKDKACTNRTCSETDTPWKKIFKLSQSLLGNQLVEDTTRNLELCFPGEEFKLGCKICVCPEMGLKEYANCSPALCDNEKAISTTKSPGGIRGDYSEDLFYEEFNGGDNAGGDEIVDELDDVVDIAGSYRNTGEEEVMISRRLLNCTTYNVSDSSPRQQCTAGSQYIIGCQICICPYMGNIKYFCRPMPETQYCEQAFPGINYVPMGRRTVENSSNNTTVKPKFPIQIKVPHNHTMHKCEEPGKVTDECFFCECEADRILVEEHCYKSLSDACVDATPTFIKVGEYPIFIKKTTK
nr:uncharacterized protein LOC110381966 [Helicoverpa armigera]